ncbi:hypothetical protein [Egicoccus halophilus]|uniref:DoxX protein n=1 Tax=Egicoccus halophilus TaxID=1670830 RepID=A0A8J3AAP5_9ACTN|nr:hypothetical protein [Egicoccus halophilus]GGI08783.1 hypothetical protein GCM10011354_30810 [Egicoccus halophilus]
MALLPFKAWHVAPRIAAGALILNSGLDKRDPDPETAAALHGMAATAYPPVRSVDPQSFVGSLSKGEVALGAALLTPLVPTGVAAAALTAFSAGLLGLYARVPGMREEGSVKPTQQGLTVAKDVWLLGIGAGLLTDVLLRRRAERADD